MEDYQHIVANLLIEAAGKAGSLAIKEDKGKLRCEILAKSEATNVMAGEWLRYAEKHRVKAIDFRKAEQAILALIEKDTQA